MGRNENNVYRMHLVDLRSLLEQCSSPVDLVQDTVPLWKEIADEMSSRETLWVFAPNKYSSRCFPTGMVLADEIRNHTDLILKNIVSRHTCRSEGGDFDAVYEEILFLVKDKREYYFDKDAIRIGHVYEGNEWGGEREKGQSAYHDTKVRRYNPNGKDPGNVWLDEIREETPGETIDKTESLPREEAISRCVRAGSEEGEIVQIWLGDDATKDIVQNEDREATLSIVEEIHE